MTGSKLSYRLREDGYYLAIYFAFWQFWLKNRDERRKFEDEMMQRIAVDKQALWNLRGGEGQVRRTNQRRKKKNNKKKAAARTAEHKNQNPNNTFDHQFVDGH